MTEAITSGQTHEVPSSVNYFRLKMVFEPHIAHTPADTQATTDRMSNYLSSFFNPGQTNIAMMESAGLNDTAHATIVREFRHGYRKFRSFAKAYLYANILADPNARPRRVRIENGFEEIYNRVKQGGIQVFNNPMEQYRIAVFEGIDKAVGERGFIVDFVPEPPLKQEDLFESDDFYNLSDSEKEALLIKIDEQLPKRDAKIKEYIEEVARIANESRRPTNLLILMGTAHAGIRNLISPELAEGAEVVINDPNAKPKGLFGGIRRRFGLGR